jgi:hypothetical protein
VNVRVHIERLVLDGLPVGRAQAGAVRAAVEAELARLLGERGLGEVSGGAVDRLPGGVMQVGEGARPAEVGGRIAEALHRSIAS